MGWVLHTDQTRDDGIFSTLFFNDEKFAVTLEHAFEDADGAYFPKLLRGATYKCVRGPHQLEHGPRFEAFEITGVPGHSGILFHVGNFNKDSDGCVLLGASLHTESSAWWIDDSLDTFKRFMAAVADVDEFDIIVE
jgi:Family of unknown function (DUF5675)